MADGKSRATWAHTSSLMSAIVAIGGSAASPDKFNPYTKIDREK